jgi:phosphopentomutase
MLLDKLSEADVPVVGIGKIGDVFLGRGIARCEKTKDNADGMAKVLAMLDQERAGLIYVNLVDFDQLYGHRNDVEGYARALEAADGWLPSVESRLGRGDLLILTADHGCDPTTSSTDHSREYVPLLVWSPRFLQGRNLGTRSSLADIGQTVAENFSTIIAKGESFLADLPA